MSRRTTHIHINFPTDFGSPFYTIALNKTEDDVQSSNDQGTGNNIGSVFIYMKII